MPPSCKYVSPCNNESQRSCLCLPTFGMSGGISSSRRRADDHAPSAHGLGSTQAGHEIAGYNNPGCLERRHSSTVQLLCRLIPQHERNKHPTHSSSSRQSWRTSSLRFQTEAQPTQREVRPRIPICKARVLSPFSPRPIRLACRPNSSLYSDQLHTEANFQVEEDSGPVDYPRPSPPPGFVRRANLNVETQFDTDPESLGASNPFNHFHNQYEEESPKSEKKNHQQMMNDLEKLSRAPSNWESKRPKRDHTAQTNPKRIDQPAGKGR